MAILSLSFHFLLCLIFIGRYHCATTTTSRGQVSGQGQNGASSGEITSCDYDFTGPADDVFIIDRSESVSENFFLRAKSFIRAFIKKSLVLRQEINRIAVITYATQTTENINLISSASQQALPVECEIFLPGGLWDRVTVDKIDPTGENLLGAVEQAMRILQLSDRQASGAVTQRLWVISDLEDARLTGLPQITVPVYGVGVGGFLNVTNFRTLVGNQFGCRYGDIASWEVALENEFESAELKSGFSLGQSVQVTDPTLCRHGNCSSSCSCYEFDDPGYGLQCDDAKGSDWMLIWVIFGTLVGVVILVNIIALLCYCRKKNRNKQPEKFNTLPTLTRSEGTSTDTATSASMTDATTYTCNRHLQQNHNNQSTGGPHAGVHPNPDDNIYENGDLADALRAHGVIPEAGQISTAQYDDQRKTRSEVNGKGKYKKNAPVKVTVSAPVNVDPRRADSQVSSTPSSHSYFEPVSDSVASGNGQPRPPYSYAYMETQNRMMNGRVENEPKSPAPSSHAYEKVNYDPSRTSEETNDFSSELARKLQRFRSRVSGIFSKKNKKSPGGINNDLEQNASVASTNQFAGQVFPQQIPQTTLYQEQKENRPVYIESSGRSDTLPSQPPPPPPIDSRPPATLPHSKPPAAVKTRQGKSKNPRADLENSLEEKNKRRSSTKLGTLKFKNLLHKFASRSGDDVVVGNVNRTESGPNGPYQVVQGGEGRNSQDMPQPFTQIM